MFRMSFALKKKKNGSLTLVLPIWFRLLFLFIVIMLSSGVFVSGIDISKQWIPVFLIIICIAGTLYEEKWIFSKSDNTIKYTFGIIAVKKKTIYKFQDIEKFQISGEVYSNTKEKLTPFRKKMIKFSLILKSGKVMDIDISTGKTTNEELKEKAQKIADYCGIELAGEQ